MISYSGGDRFGCSRLLEAELEAVYSRIVGRDWDGGGWGSNTVFSYRLWELLKQVHIKPICQLQKEKYMSVSQSASIITQGKI